MATIAVAQPFGRVSRSQNQLNAAMASIVSTKKAIAAVVDTVRQEPARLEKAIARSSATLGHIPVTLPPSANAYA